MSQHPLDPLSGPEFRAVAEVLRRERAITPAWRYASVELREPPKADLLAWRSGDPVPRAALAVLWNREDNQAYEAVVDLTGDGAGSVEAWTHRPGVTPAFTVDEWHECDEAMRAHPDVIAALAQRGVTDTSLLLVDVWTYGGELVPQRWRDRRVGWCDVWRRATPQGSPYAHPVAGIKLVVDMNTMDLLEIDMDTAPDPGSPDVQGEYAPGPWTGQQRTDLKPLEIAQPQGVSFTLEGNELSWQRWRMRIGFNHREGLVIHQLSYDDRGQRRSIAHRMSFAEMVVPYRDASFDHYRRTAYDIGEWGLGFMTTSLELGCDCLGETAYLDATLHDTRGEPYDIPRAVCLHEEDDGVLWKHVDDLTGAQVRRSRRMVVSCHVTVANYEYLVYWRFYQDGNVECEVRATGIMVTTPLPVGAPTPASGTLVDERTYAPFHQHFIVARLDMDVDGTGNTVLEVDTHAEPVGGDNPHGLSMVTTSTPVRSEAEAGRSFSWERQRTWKVVNPNRTNAHGAHPGYKLVPSASIPVMMDPSSVQHRRAPVMGRTLWVTRQHDDERWPAGAYPTQSVADDGMTRWTADDEPLENTDVVLWYVFGIHHVTRPEDWPVMPVDVVSFWLKPFGFFDENPALDVAPSPGRACGA